MRLPKFLYELYPALYVIGGIAAISLVDSYVAQLSGIILATGGIAIMLMRRNYRVLKDQMAQLS